jgi:hypothetical protein
MKHAGQHWPCSTEMLSNRNGCNCTGTLSRAQVVFKRWDGARVWYPNEKINTAAITNVTRTDTRCQCFRVRRQAT